MVSVEVSETIARPPADVFAFVSDMRNESQWHTDVLQADLTAGTTVGQGSTFAVRYKPMMGMSEATSTVVEYDPPRKVVFDIDMGKMHGTNTMVIEADGDASRITRRVDVEPGGFLKIMSPVMGGMIRKANAGFLANLKRVLEGS